MPWSSNWCNLGWWFVFCLLTFWVSFMCQRTLRVVVGAGNGYVSFYQIICEFLFTASSFFFLSTQIWHCLFCFYLLLSSLLLHHAPYVIVVSIMQSGNYTKKKLKGKKSVSGNLSPVAATLLAASFGFTMWEFARGGSLSRGINDCCVPIISQLTCRLRWVRVHLWRREAFPALAPQGDGCASLQVLISIDSQALQFEVSFHFSAAWGAGKATHSSRALWAQQCC